MERWRIWESLDDGDYENRPPVPEVEYTYSTYGSIVRFTCTYGTTEHPSPPLGQEDLLTNDGRPMGIVWEI